MKRTLFLLFLVYTVSASAQFAVEIEQGIGISSFSKKVMPFDVKLSEQTSIHLSYNFGSLLSLNLGAGYQTSGAKSEIIFTNTYGTLISTEDIIYIQNFLKIPLDLSFRFGDKIRVGIDLGGFYNIMLRNMEVLPEGVESGGIDLNYLGGNILGIRMKPGLDFRINDRLVLKTGALYERSIESENSTEKYNFYLNTGLKVQL